MKSALVTGVSGQDGSYMAELLLKKGYTVYGTVHSKTPRWPYGFRPGQERLHIRYLDLGQPDSIWQLLMGLSDLDECYNFAAQSHVGQSFLSPGETYAVTGIGACLLMDAFFKLHPRSRFYQASTSEMFGASRDEGKLTLEDAFSPLSPYAVAKVAAHYNALRHCQDGKFAVSGVLFNHESERRPESFVTQKIARFVAQVRRWLHSPSRLSGWGDMSQPMLELGYTGAMRDWGYAPEYMEAVYAAMQCDYPAAWLLGTGKSITVQTFLELAFARAGIGDWQTYVRTDVGTYTRPQEVEYLRADPADLQHLLGRTPIQVGQLVNILVDFQMREEW